MRATLARAYRAGVRRLAALPAVLAVMAPLIRFLAPRVAGGAQHLPDPVVFEGIALHHGNRPSYTVRALAEGDYETETRHELAQRLQPGDMFVDVGAHIGLFTILAAKLVGSDGRVLAFEPDRDTFGYLTKNVDINDLDPAAVTLFCKAAGSVSRTSSLWRDPHDSGSSSLIERSFLDKTSGVVDVQPLDSWASENGWPAVRLIKLDCEGSEIDVILGMREWCRRGPIETAVVEVNAAALEAASGSVEGLFDALRDGGFVSFRDLRDGESVVSRSRMRRLVRESRLIPMNIVAVR